MSDFFKKNLIYLRLLKGETQAETATELGFSRSTYANYENGDNLPKSDNMNKIIGHFSTTIDEILNSDLTEGNLIHENGFYKIREKGILKGNPSGNLKQQIGNVVTDIMAQKNELKEPQAKYKKEGSQMPKVVTVDSRGDENVVYVPIKARAGYLLGYGDPNFIDKLPVYSIPGYRNGTYRVFEVEGVSMFPTLQSSDRVISRWVGITEIIDDRVYVIVTKNDGILIKRIINRYREQKLIVKSDHNHNGEFPTLVLNIDDIEEVWYVVERWTKQLPGPGEIYKRIVNLEAELALLKYRLGN